MKGGCLLAKQIWKPSTMLNPVPVVMVTCTDNTGKSNIITLAWVGTINTDPPMVSISVRKQRYSYELLKQKGEFVINMPPRSLTFATDFCGVKSGRDLDKFEAMRLTPEKASKVDVPLIRECPVNLECVVRQVIELGSHDLFLAEVVATNVEERLLDESGRLNLDKADLICYSHGEYYSLGTSLGYFGFSVTKKKKLKRDQKKPLEQKSQKSQKSQKNQKNQKNQKSQKGQEKKPKKAVGSRKLSGKGGKRSEKNHLKVDTEK